MMDEQMLKYKLTSLCLCDTILSELRRNENDACSFFKGELYQVYADATEMAINKTRNIRNKFNNL